MVSGRAVDWLLGRVRVNVLIAAIGAEVPVKLEQVIAISAFFVEAGVAVGAEEPIFLHGAGTAGAVRPFFDFLQ